MGVEKKATKIPAETMVARLKQKDGILDRNWVGKLVVTVSKVKSYISRRSIKEKKEAEEAITMREVVVDADPPEENEEATAQNELAQGVVEESIDNQM